MQGAVIGGEGKGPLVFPLQNLKPSLNSHKGFRYNTLCNWQQQEVKFYIPAPELTELIEAHADKASRGFT